MTLVVKNLPVNAGDLRGTGSILRSGRSPGEGNGNPLQYSCLENSMDRGVLWAIVHGVAKSQTWLKWLHMHLLFLLLLFSSCVLCLFLLIFFIIMFFICSGFCHTLKWNSHGFTCVPHPDPPSHLPLHPIPLGLPSAPAPSACVMHPTWTGDLFHPR